MKSKEKTEKTITHIQEVEVAFSDIDALHIVWHGKYVKYFEDAREGFGKKYGFGYMDFHDQGFMAPLVDLQLSYKKMVEYEETLNVHITYVPVEAAKIIFTYEIYNEKDEVVCTGKTVQVMTSFHRELILVAPLFIKEWKQKWLNESQNK